MLVIQFSSVVMKEEKVVSVSQQMFFNVWERSLKGHFHFVICNNFKFWNFRIFLKRKHKFIHIIRASMYISPTILFLYACYLRYSRSKKERKRKEKPLFISIQIIIQKRNRYQSSWIIVYVDSML